MGDVVGQGAESEGPTTPFGRMALAGMCQAAGHSRTRSGALAHGPPLPPAPALCRRVSQILATALPTGGAIPILQTGKVRPQGTQHRCRSLSATPGCPESSPLLFPPREKQLRAAAGAAGAAPRRPGSSVWWAGLPHSCLPAGPLAGFPPSLRFASVRKCCV